ncbi:PadR family transcriptional regulator [Caldisericum exile]|uniref:PadR family transcriptional regulator n=1 Tax=Caldisericum exile (strain DSM 21853 / NBRC 104410 / AZM16c01) TaxID=511051 RepID=A0A7U6GFP1_CALEA|nr:PadR family transcriptional regulator [Caldisericum exile]BAL81553.1 putative PadR family transcriptional regulator [Caldisericum exile AZM16c01]
MKRKCGRGCANFTDIGVSQNIVLRAWILSYLKLNGPKHGYDIISGFIETFKNLAEDFGPSEMGAFYKIMRMFEMEGLVTSSWEISVSGPAKRVYTITEKGIEELKDLEKKLQFSKSIIEKLINMIKEASR